LQVVDAIARYYAYAHDLISQLCFLAFSGKLDYH